MPEAGYGNLKCCFKYQLHKKFEILCRGLMTQAAHEAARKCLHCRGSMLARLVTMSDGCGVILPN